MKQKPRIGIIMGDAAGIGPEIIIKTLSDPLIFSECEPYVFGSTEVFRDAISMLGLPIQVHMADRTKFPNPCTIGNLHVIDCDIEKNKNFSWGVIDGLNGRNCENAFREAFKFVAEGMLDCLVFGPLNKESMHRGGMNHPDESGMMREITAVPAIKSVVKWNQLFRCTVVGHIPFSQIVASLHTDKVIEAIRTLGMVIRQFLPHLPRIGVASLNPHAGEGGDFGDEENRILKPAIEAGRKLFDYIIEGPFPADTIIHKALKNELDGIVYLYHDQGNIAMKAIGFGEGVVIYSGMPIYVTTPGHGTAHNIAGQGIADPSNFREALMVSLQLAKS